MNWNDVVERVAPCVVKIETPSGHGTGFLCVYNEARDLCTIATAHHVVQHADQWQEPIRISHLQTGSSAFLKESDRVIWHDAVKDSAVILMSVGELQFPQQPVPLLPVERRLPVGIEVGWLGYPALAEYTLCFFSGNVSAWQDFRKAYLIDGVAINGVSGGPVLYSSQTDGVQIVGSISAYRANRATGEALPGLSVAQDVSHFQETAARIRSFDEANRQQAAQPLPAVSVDESAPPVPSQTT